jgi:hypothetical protein
MSAKRKTAESKHKKVRVEAEKYLWHLRPPWMERFDHGHWWKKDKATQDAAMWEVLRRHPQAEKLLCKDQTLNANLFELELHIKENGHRAWPEAIQTDIKFAKYWGKSLGSLPPQWGVVKHGMFDVDQIQDRKIQELGRRFNDSLQRYQSPEKIDHDALRSAYRIWNATHKEGNMSVPDLDSNVGAFNALFNGCVLVGFDPTKPGIAEMVEKTVRGIINEAKRGHEIGNTARKSYWEAWLDVIAQFEDSEIPRILSRLPPRKIPIRNDQLFARYRRSYKNRPWPS